jgi:hypothetical protein
LEKIKKYSARTVNEGSQRDGRKRIPVRGRLQMHSGAVLRVGGVRAQERELILQQVIGVTLEVHHGLCEGLVL